MRRRRTGQHIFLLTTIAIGGAFLLGAGCGDSDTSTSQPTNPGTRAEPKDIESNAEIPEFTSADEARVRQIIETDPTMAEVLGASSLVIEQVGLWHVGSTKIGGAAQVRFDPAVTGEFSIPLVSFETDRPCGNVTNPEYQRKTRQVRAEGMTTAAVSVDLQLEEVVAIRPHDFDRVVSLETPDPDATRGFPVQC